MNRIVTDAKPLCSVIIPVHNHASLTRQCLNTLLAHPATCVETEIIVVDDGSTDATPEFIASYGEQIHVITHATRRGFATACNDGMAAASGSLHVLLNNDTIPQDGWLDALVRYAHAHPSAAVVGSKLLYLNDTIQHAGVVITQDRWARHIYAGFPADHPVVNTSRRFQVVTAACALIRREPFEAVGGFDTAFINGVEDVDLCLRLGALGYEIHYCHESVLYHLESASRDSRPTEYSHNAQIYSERWAHRVRPDDLDYYLADGLLRLDYRDLETFPIRMVVSPLLAVVDGDASEPHLDQLLDQRARQVYTLARENRSLTVRLQDATIAQSGYLVGRADTENQS